MLTALKLTLALVIVTSATQMTLAEGSGSKATSTNKKGEMVVVVGLPAQDQGAAVVDTDEPRIEILMLKAQRRTQACAIAVQAILDRAFDVYFQEPDVL
jgi:hypothetical protein